MKKMITICILGMITSIFISANAYAGQWQSDAKGWWYQRDDGSYPHSEWMKEGNSWYYFRDNGYMAKGWANDSGTWYYLNQNGTMATGWVQDGTKWYYLLNNGNMAKGWINHVGKWYYLGADGIMFTNTTVNGYQLGDDGAWIRDMVAEKEDALRAYAEFLRQEKIKFEKERAENPSVLSIAFRTMYIDNDDIPELILSYTYYGGDYFGGPYSE